RFAIDRGDLDQLRAALARWRRFAFDLDAGTQLEFADEIGRHVNVVRADLEALGGIAEKAESFLSHFQHAAHGAVCRLRRLGFWLRRCGWLVVLAHVHGLTITGLVRLAWSATE